MLLSFSVMQKCSGVVLPLSLDSHLYDGEIDVPCVSAPLSIAGPAGDLEAITSLPLEIEAMRAVAVICHPHPLYGGTMANKVVHYMSRTFNEMGVGTLRFNFRGVGASAGSYAHGAGETEDLLAVLDWIEEQYPGYAVWLAGFSFGAYIALCGAGLRPVARLITVAPPANLFDLNAVPLPSCPWLLIQGDQDEIVPCDEVLDWVDSLARPPRVICMRGVDHFFHGHLNELRDKLKGALAPRATKTGDAKVA